LRDVKTHCTYRCVHRAITDACDIAKDQVELLTLKAPATDIIKGTLAEVQEKVVVAWCKLKVLGSDRL
jgi:hypothetical protein